MTRTTAFAVVLFAVFGMSAHADTDGAKLLESKCASCHARSDEGLTRIKDSRRTPEGWDMTLVRMAMIHGVEMTGSERSTLVKHLADTRGLAPEETAPYRYILERRSNLTEDQPDETIAVMCARCHSYARVALQRRTREDWTKHAHWHLGQWPTIEYQALGRDRNWWEIASTETPDLLAGAYPLETGAWAAWKSYESPDLSGKWKVVGHTPGRGAYHGVMTVEREKEDTYTVQLDIDDGGSGMTGTGRAIVYTGYEWRASLDLDGQDGRQVLAHDAASDTLSGRWFLADNDVIGGEVIAVRDSAAPRILAVQPSHLKAGESAEIAVHGVGLDGAVDLGNGVEVTETVSSSLTAVVVKATAAADGSAGARAVTVGSTTAADMFTVYDQIDSVRVEPVNAIARLGGDGPLAAVPAQFDAVAYLNGGDGAPGTEDDVRIGVVPAKWSVDNFTELAASLNDSKFAGNIDPDVGLFMPAGAGPNPQRPFSTNNAGDLLIKATVSDGDAQLEGTAHLVVTVQRWNDPPIR